MMVRVSRFSPADSIAETALQGTGMWPIWNSAKFGWWLGDFRRWWWDPSHSGLSLWPGELTSMLMHGLTEERAWFLTLLSHLLKWKQTSSQRNEGRGSTSLILRNAEWTGDRYKTTDSCHCVAFWYCVVLVSSALSFSLPSFVPNGIELICLFS